MSSSSRRPRGSTSSSSNGREVEIEEFMMKLQQLIPQLKRHGTSSTKISEEALKEACKHIKRLHRQVEELSSTLSQLLLNDITAAADIADVIQNIIISSSD